MLDSMEADRALVAKADAQILNLETQISALQIAISELNAAKGPAEQRLNAYKYPVLTLPNEIITEIFLQFLPPYPDAPPLVGLYSPTSLTHICGQWRAIALTTPVLWRAGAIYRRTSVKEGIWFAELWWKRSSPYPLSIRADDYNDWSPIFSAALPHRARWQHLDLNVDLRNDAHMPLRNALEEPMPLLRTLKIFLHASVKPLTLRSENVPLLRSATLDDESIQRFILPWAQLTSLTLLAIHSEFCVPVLLQAAHLVNLTMELCYPYLTENPAATELMLPCLERLLFLPTSDADMVF
ncbi:F-box domain-containing protein [Favolaschia claudopus]|uniref:F-box domain-containing protein n=1 Tax=Favolaschia claudopus TaxID=2862362 RepID=A0AAW0DC04_9AGAR